MSKVNVEQHTKVLGTGHISGQSRPRSDRMHSKCFTGPRRQGGRAHGLMLTGSQGECQGEHRICWPVDPHASQEWNTGISQEVGRGTEGIICRINGCCHLVKPLKQSFIGHGLQLFILSLFLICEHTLLI